MLTMRQVDQSRLRKRRRRHSPGSVVAATRVMVRGMGLMCACVCVVLGGFVSGDVVVCAVEGGTAMPRQEKAEGE